MAGAQVTLWHIAISHYSEKVRWGLAYKSVPHRRRSPMPGLHMLLAAWLTRGRAITLPIVRIDGWLMPAAGWSFTIGIVLFSGSLYALALTGVSIFGALTPVGGVAFVLGWAFLAIAAL